MNIEELVSAVRHRHETDKEMPWQTYEAESYDTAGNRLAVRFSYPSEICVLVVEQPEHTHYYTLARGQHSRFYKYTPATFMKSSRQHGFDTWRISSSWGSEGAHTWEPGLSVEEIAERLIRYSNQDYCDTLGICHNPTTHNCKRLPVGTPTDLALAEAPVIDSKPPAISNV
jgi:hypothetical protein